MTCNICKSDANHIWSWFEMELELDIWPLKMSKCGRAEQSAVKDNNCFLALSLCIRLLLVPNRNLHHSSETRLDLIVSSTNASAMETHITITPIITTANHGDRLAMSGHKSDLIT